MEPQNPHDGVTNSLRCSPCGISWPFNFSEYGTCPECLGTTSGIGNETPISDDEARSRKRHAEFERWLDANNRRHPIELLNAIPVAGEIAT